MPNAAGRIILVCKLKGGADATTTCRELACGRGRRGPAGRASGPGQPGAASRAGGAAGRRTKGLTA
jgi:hypothetical protein